MEINRLARNALAAFAMAASALLAPVQAAPVLSISVSPGPIVGFSQAVTADVFVSGLEQAIGGFSFILGYDATRMSFDTATLDPDGKMGALPLDFSIGTDVLMLADAAITEPALAGLQGAGFRLGSFTFTSLTTEGFADFGLTFATLSDFLGNGDIDGVTATGAQVCVSRDGTTACGAQVPEPMTTLLVGAALGALALTRRQRKAA